MKAVHINKYGGPEVIEMNNSVATPSAKADELVIEVHGASLNRIDTALRAGYLKKMLPLQFPITLGGDFAGVVSEVGTDVSHFNVGDEVYGNAGPFKGGSGSLAEFVAAKAGNTGPKPTQLSFTEAAALPLVATSALQGLEDHIHLKAGQTILIHGGAGGIGSIAIQLAKLIGARVITTVSKEEIGFVQQLGADEVIDYQSQKFTDLVKDVDAVFDTVGGDIANQSLQVLKKGGRLVSMAGQPDQGLATKYGVTVLSQATSVSAEQLAYVAELVDSGKISPYIEKTFPFSETKQAFTYFETAQPKGKIVVSLK